MTEPVQIRALSVLPDARFACQGTGQCCKGYLVAPIDDLVAARIDAHTFTLNAEQIGASGFELRTLDGRVVRMLRRVAGQCVFLLGDGRCAVHAEMGADAKPALCRRYPLNVAVDPDGVAYLSLNMECGGYAEGRHGPLLAETIEADLDAILALPPLRVADVCRVSPGDERPYDAVFDTFEGPWLEDVDTPGTLADVAAALCARLWGVEPSPGVWPESALRARATQVVAYATGVATEEADADPVDADLHRTLVEIAALAEGGSPPPEVEALLRDQIRHAIFGKALHRAPSLAAGMGHLLLQVWLVAGVAETVAQAVAAQRVVNRCLRQSAPQDAAFAVALTRQLAGLAPAPGGA